MSPKPHSETNIMPNFIQLNFSLLLIDTQHEIEITYTQIGLVLLSTTEDVIVA